jgi:cyanophycinase
MTPSKGTLGKDRGYIIAIGGAERKRNNPRILRRFVELCGGGEARISVIPTATESDGTGDRYVRIFRRMKVGDVVCLNIKERDDCYRDDYSSRVEESSGVFLSGGNQLRLSTILGGTPVARAIRRLNADGLHVAGTSAGAAIIPEHMIAGGKSGPTPTRGAVQISPGLGLTNSLIIDQHFRQRDRLGRLLTAISYNPFLTGVGLDEDTAIFINPKNEFEVVGSRAVTVVDPSELKSSSVSSAKRGQAINLVGVKLHVLASGARYNIDTREVTLPEAGH